MTKEKALELVMEVYQKRSDKPHILHELDKVHNFITSDKEYNHQFTMQYINSLIPVKLSGSHGEVNTALSFLKDILKKGNRNGAEET